jgi:hypothetical protein
MSHYMRIPIYPARDSDSIPATHSDLIPATWSDVLPADGVTLSQQVYDGHLMVKGFRSRLWCAGFGEGQGNSFPSGRLRKDSPSRSTR